MNRAPTTARLLLPVLSAGLLLGACDDTTAVEEHLDVEGFALNEGLAEIYRYTLDDGIPTALTLSQGTHDVVFVPLGHDGEPLLEDADEDEELVLQITIDDTGVLTWTPEELPDGTDVVQFHGQLDALQAGSTTMNVCVPHAGHCDFDVDVPVTVTAP